MQEVNASRITAVLRRMPLIGRLGVSRLVLAMLAAAAAGALIGGGTSLGPIWLAGHHNPAPTATEPGGSSGTLASLGEPSPASVEKTSATAAPTQAPKPKPTAVPGAAVGLSPQPAAGIGTFTDDFTGDTVGQPPDDNWRIDTGRFYVELVGTNKVLESYNGGIYRISHPGVGANLTMSVGVVLDPGATMAGVAVRYQDASDYEMCKLWNGKLALGRYRNASFNLLASVPYSAAAGVAYRLNFQASGSTYSCSVEGGPTVTAVDPTFSNGRIGLFAAGVVAFDNVKAIGRA